MYHWFNVGIMKDTWNVYDWGKNLVNDRFRLISNLLLLFIILFLGFQNVYGDFTREGFLYAYPVSILVFAFPIYLNIYWLVPRFLYKAKRKLWYFVARSQFSECIIRIYISVSIISTIRYSWVLYTG